MMKLSEKLLKPYLWIPILEDQSIEGLDEFGRWAEEATQLEAQNAALKRENSNWRAYVRDSKELSEAISMSGNMRVSQIDSEKMRVMTARRDALLTAKEDEDDKSI